MKAFIPLAYIIELYACVNRQNTFNITYAISIDTAMPDGIKRELSEVTEGIVKDTGTNLIAALKFASSSLFCSLFLLIAFGVELSGCNFPSILYATDVITFGLFKPTVLFATNCAFGIILADFIGYFLATGIPLTALKEVEVGTDKNPDPLQ